MLHGREHDLEDLGQLLGDEPLVLVRGAWGCGKSELLRAFALRLYREDPDLPVYLIDIEGVQERDALIARIAERMMLANLDEKSVVLALHEQATPVLLLDECDALELEAVRWVRSLCDRCPGATIYCAMQRELGIEALSFELPNLPTERPSEGGVSPAAQMVLALSRTQRTGADEATLDEEWAQQLATFVRGNPRAIRFAVGLLGVLTPQALLEEIRTSSSALMEGERATELVRRFETFLWSRLSDESKSLLSSIAVFPGGVGIASLAELDGGVPTALLAELETLSLIERQGDSIRSAPLVEQLIRKLSEELHGEALVRWSNHFAERASLLLPSLQNPAVREGRQWFRDNEEMLRLIARTLRITESIGDNQADLMIGLALALRIDGRPDGALIEGAHALVEDSERQARLLAQESRSHLESGAFDKFVALAELAEGRWEAAPAGQARDALYSLAVGGRWWKTQVPPQEEGGASRTPEMHRFRAASEYRRGNLEATEQAYRAWVDTCPVATEGLQYTLALCCLGFIYTQRNKLEPAERALSEALRTAKALGTPRYEALANLHLSELRYRQGEIASARALAERALERFVALGVVLLAADARSVCGDLLFAEGERKQAQHQYNASLRIYALGNRKLRSARTTLRLAALAASSGNDPLAEEYRTQAIDMMDLQAHDDALTLDAWTAFIRGDVARLEAAVVDDPKPGEAVWYEWLLARDAYRTCSRQLSEYPPERVLLVVADDGTWFEPPEGDRYRFRRDTPMRRMARALFRARAERSGQPLTSEELFEIGWPGQRTVGTSGANRLWVTLSRLRGLGLGDALQKVEAGYLIDPNVDIRFDS